MRCLADQVDDARSRGRRVDIDKVRRLAHGFVEEADGIVVAAGARGGQCPPRAKAFAALCAAERSRLHDSDPERWEEAASRWEIASEPYPAAYCRWREAEALLDHRTGRNRADECLHDARRVTVSLGSLPLRERIESLAQRARISLCDVGDASATQSSTVAGDLGLTPRELEVLGLLAAGRTDREIAEFLFISKKTASVHVSNFVRKLDVANRFEAGRIGQGHGLHSPSAVSA